MPDIIPDIIVSEPELKNSGFTASGIERYTKTVKEYSKILFEKSINYGEIDKAVIREVTHDHVKASAHSIANSFGKPNRPNYLWAMKIGQYLCAALVGVATNHLDNLFGTLGFIISFTIGVLLVYFENVKK